MTTTLFLGKVIGWRGPFESRSFSDSVLPPEQESFRQRSSRRRAPAKTLRAFVGRSTNIHKLICLAFESRFLLCRSPLGRPKILIEHVLVPAKANRLEKSSGGIRAKPIDEKPFLTRNPEYIGNLYLLELRLGQCGERASFFEEFLPSLTGIAGAGILPGLSKKSGLRICAEYVQRMKTINCANVIARCSERGKKRCHLNTSCEIQ